MTRRPNLVVVLVDKWDPAPATFGGPIDTPVLDAVAPWAGRPDADLPTGRPFEA